MISRSRFLFQLLGDSYKTTFILHDYIPHILTSAKAAGIRTGHNVP